MYGTARAGLHCHACMQVGAGNEQKQGLELKTFKTDKGPAIARPPAAPPRLQRDNRAGVSIEADFLLKATGCSPNSRPLQNGLQACGCQRCKSLVRSAPSQAALDNRGWLKVNKHLQVEGFANLFAAGDIIATQELKYVRWQAAGRP